MIHSARFNVRCYPCGVASENEDNCIIIVAKVDIPLLSRLDSHHQPSSKETDCSAFFRALGQKQLFATASLSYNISIWYLQESEVVLSPYMLRSMLRSMLRYQTEHKRPDVSTLPCGRSLDVLLGLRKVPFVRGWGRGL